MASMGSILLAFNAGFRPERTPVRKLKISAKKTTLNENSIGILNSFSKVPSRAILSNTPAIPPRMVIKTDSKRKESRIPFLVAPYALLMPISFFLS